MSARPKIPTAVLVSVQLPKDKDAEVKESLMELERLVTTLGYQVVGTITQNRSSDKAPAVIGEGKLVELARYTGGSGEIKATFEKKKSKAALKFKSEGAESPEVLNKTEEDASAYPQAQVVIFDRDLSPSQLRNVESAAGVPVLDRTGVIIEIFNRHAKSKIAKLQIEIAHLNYTAPRMRETGTGQDRGAGGVGAKGVGESKVELDRRRIRDRLKELKTQLSLAQAESSQRRERRADENCVALVGYTNAGKSSLMRALTGSDVLVADQLFATLDTTVRPLKLATGPKILVSDTVGFIKKLPHDLVASFKSTLDEALQASYLLYVVDASDPSFRSQWAVTREVLKEVGAEDIPHLMILNKCDKLSHEDKGALLAEFPNAVLLSTRNKEDIARLSQIISDFFEKDMVDERLFIKHGTPKVIGEIRNSMRILKEDYENEGVYVQVRSSPETLARLKKQFGLG